MGGGGKVAYTGPLLIINKETFLKRDRPLTFPRSVVWLAFVCIWKFSASVSMYSITVCVCVFNLSANEHKSHTLPLGINMDEMSLWIKINK